MSKSFIDFFAAHFPAECGKDRIIPPYIPPSWIADIDSTTATIAVYWLHEDMRLFRWDFETSTRRFAKMCGCIVEEPHITMMPIFETSPSSFALHDEQEYVFLRLAASGAPFDDIPSDVITRIAKAYSETLLANLSLIEKEYHKWRDNEAE